MEKRLNGMDVSNLESCCTANDDITVKTVDKANQIVYKSRLLFVNMKRNFIIIDELSPESTFAMPLFKGQAIEIFFLYKGFRYCFLSRITDHVVIRQDKGLGYGLKITFPSVIKDGEDRRYFRLETDKKSPVIVHFTVHKKGSKHPGMADLPTDTAEELKGEMIKISGGGFSMMGDKTVNLDTGDIIKARFRLRPSMPEFDVWSKVRNKRWLRNTDTPVWGLMFMGEKKNKSIESIRNKIMKYVAEG